MPQVVEAKCPGCQQTLRFPADWMDQALRCKHCGTMVQVKGQSAPLNSAKVDAARATAAPSQPAATEILQPTAHPAAPDHANRPNGSAASDTLRPFALDQDVPFVRAASRRRRARGGRWVVLLGVGVSLALVAGGSYFFWEQIKRAGNSLSNFVADKGEEAERKKTISTDSHLLTGEAFPRRVLVICVNNYLYANPVSYGVQQHDVSALTERLRRVLHIDATQFVELSDAARAAPDKPVVAGKAQKSTKGKTTPEKSAKGKVERPAPSPARPPLKPVIEKTVGDFLDTSRAQDRLLVLFIGHVIELEEAVYLVPLEGDMKAKESLIPLAWVYDRLQQCKARQKVLVIDTCRLDPGRGQERPGSGPMSAKVDAMLAKPPLGVQVWSACSAEQYSYELDGDSVFLGKLYESLDGRTFGKMQQQQDPLPVAALALAVEKTTAAEVATQLKAKQSPRLAGTEVEGGASFDKNEPMPTKITIPLPPTPPGGIVKPEEIREILKEIELPPIKLARSDTASLQIETLVPFAAKKMEAYQSDASVKEILTFPEKYPLRVAVLDAVKLLREKFNPKTPEVALRDYFSGNGSEAIKKAILKEQEKPADVLSDLDLIHQKLAKFSEAREDEPSKRWQAHYDYVLAQVLARIAYLREYSLMLGKIRKDELPNLEPNHSGFRLASRERLQSNTEVKAIAKEARDLLTKVAKRNKGTPWEILAKRDQLTALGLEWQSTR